MFRSSSIIQRAAYLAALISIALFVRTPALAQYDLFRANLHVHTSISGSEHSLAGIPSMVVDEAAVNLIDVVGFSDHTPMSSDGWTQLAQTADQHQVEWPIAIRGFEWTWKGALDPDAAHVNVFGTQDNRYAQGSVSLQDLYGWLKAAPVAAGYPCKVAQLNHVYLGDHLDNFSYWDAGIDKIVCLAEIGSGEGAAYTPPSSGETYWRQALQAGWHVAPSIGIDNYSALTSGARTRHTGLFLDPADPRGHTVRDLAMLAISDRRVFASEDANFRLSFLCKRDDQSSWHWMGETIMARPTGYDLSIEGIDADVLNPLDYFSSVDVLTSSGTTVRSWGATNDNYFSANFHLTYDQIRALPTTSRGETSFYVRIRQQGALGVQQDYIYSAPIWIRHYTPVSGTISTNTTWTEADSPYLVSGTLTVSPGVTLTIDPGAVVKFQDTNSQIDCRGNLMAQGTAAAPIYFTSYRDDAVGGNTDNSTTSPSRGNWGRIYINGTGATGTFDHCVIRYGGSTQLNWPYANLACKSGTLSITNSTVSQSVYYGITCESMTSPQITGCTISSCNQDGVYMTSCTSPVVTGCQVVGNSTGISMYSCPSPSLTNSSFDGNTSRAAYLNGASIDLSFSGITATASGNNGLWLDSCTASADSHWTANNGLVYVVANALTVSAGKTLTIDPGAVVKFQDTNSQIDCRGNLMAQGTAAAPIYFTSYRDDAVGGNTDNSTTSPSRGNWGRIYINGTGATGTFDHCVIRYGGSTYLSSPWASLACAMGRLSVTCSTIAQSGYYGIHCNNAQKPVVKNSVVAYTNQEGIYITGSSAKLTYSDFWSAVGNQFGTFAVLTGTINADPLFANAGSGDYHLQRNSPCIDSGDPTMQDADGTRIDMGAFPYASGAPRANIVGAKLRADESIVTVSGSIVIAGTDVFGGYFYMEDLERTSGIRVLTDSVIGAGITVEVTGRMFTENGERQLEAYLITPGPQATIPRPLFMANKTIGGGDWQYDSATGVGQKGITDGFGLNNTGLLVRTSGAFTYVDPHTFMLDDGSGVSVKCVVPDSVALDHEWTQVTATGISSCEMAGEELHRLLRVRGQSDIVPH